MNKRDALDALRAVYERGEACQSCQCCYRVSEKERLSGRRVVVETYRFCGLIDIIEEKRGGDPAECPGVEDEINKEKEYG